MELTILRIENKIVNCQLDNGATEKEYIAQLVT